MSEINQDAFTHDGKGDNSYYESLLELQKTDPGKYASLSPALKMSLGFYVEEKQKRENEKQNVK